jgi:polyisoprenoid-binding protein YceI
MFTHLLRWGAGSLLAVHLVAAERPLSFDPVLSTVEVGVKATVDSFTGRLAHYRLAGAVDEAGRFTRAELDFHFADVVTGKPKRDRAMHDWQQTEKFPDAHFALTALTVEAAGGWRAEGQFTLHGATQRLAFPVTITRDGSAYAIDGEAAIDTRAFGLPIIRLMGVLKVDPLVRVKFHLQGKTS